MLCLSILIELMGIANIVDPNLFLSEFKKSIYILANKQIHRAQLDFGEFPSRFPFAIYRHLSPVRRPKLASQEFKLPPKCGQEIAMEM